MMTLGLERVKMPLFLEPTTGRVRSVEAFTLGGYTWRYLPAMNDIRSAPTATVLPTKNVH